MLKVGLTGGIGSGKSTVSSFMKNRGVPIVDADLIAREVLEKHPEIIEGIKNNFGSQYIDQHGRLKRREFGNFIFKNEDEKSKYEGLIMPFIKKEIFSQMEAYERSGERMCVLDAPTLIEQGLHKEMDMNVLVWVDERTQVSRVMTRDDMTKQQVIDRLKSQMSMEDKKKCVDMVMDNSGSIQETEEQVMNFLHSLKF